MSSQILSYINIFDINRKPLAQAMDVKYCVSNIWQMHKRVEVGTIILNFTYFSYFFQYIVKILFYYMLMTLYY